MNTAEDDLDREADEEWARHYQPKQNPGDGRGKQDTGNPQAASSGDGKPNGKGNGQTSDTPGQASPGPESYDQLSKAQLDARYRNSQALMTQATQESAVLRNQIGPLEEANRQLTGEVERLKAENSQLKARLSEHPGNRTQPTGSTSEHDEALNRLSEEDPELVKPIAGKFQRTDTELSDLRGEVRSLKDEAAKREKEQKQKAEQDGLAAHWAAIKKVHPDVEAVVRTDDFRGWAIQQPPALQMALQQGTSDDVIWALNQYKAAVGIPSNLDAARAAESPNVGRVRQQETSPSYDFTQDQIDGMSEEEYAENEAAIDKAMATGRIRR